MKKAVILARGLGKRMRRKIDDNNLNARQTAVADKGIKALIPINNRPFLDYVLNTLADVGYHHICLVIGPEHNELRTYYGEILNVKRLSIDFAIQPKPLGTADAVLAAEAFVADDPFLVINSDTYYPPQALNALRRLEEPGLVVFERDALLLDGNIPAERVTKFAVVKIDCRRYVTRIIEKPDGEILGKLPEPIYVSMNCWRFDSTIFTACRKIGYSSRGELELPTAVQYMIGNMGRRMRVVFGKGMVLDLTGRGDVDSVSKRLADVEVSL